MSAAWRQYTDFVVGFVWQKGSSSHLRHPDLKVLLTDTERERDGKSNRDVGRYVRKSTIAHIAAAIVPMPTDAGYSVVFSISSRCLDVPTRLFICLASCR